MGRKLVLQQIPHLVRPLRLLGLTERFVDVGQTDGPIPDVSLVDWIVPLDWETVLSIILLE